MLVFKFNGGTVCKNIDNNTTHVVIHSRYVYKLLIFLFILSNKYLQWFYLIFFFFFSCIDNISMYESMNKDRKQAFEIVDENWITQQIKW